ncbi:alpha/beta hydrolase family protein [Roseateles sp.]|uniref:alpha/beta hydrolase family protein n=1 Tax=Roseateles sp. TaxID=1971397 RepID=UPI0039E91EF3
MRRLLAAAALLGVAAVAAAQQRTTLSVEPHATDARLAVGQPAHWIAYDPANAGPLLVWLPGTNGQPEHGPKALFATVLDEGYRLVALSYIDTPAVAQVCVPARLRKQPACAGRFRQQRVWGDEPNAPVDDRPEDAIVTRLTQLLRHLAERDPTGQWQGYLDGEEPRWSRIVLAGQSQGGGMAAFLAQTRTVAGVVMFSGGWDHGANGDLAAWYRRRSATPPTRWQATYNVQEPQAGTLDRIYRTLGIPSAQVHALDLPVVSRLPHTDGVGNAAYAPLWHEMLATVRPQP